MAQNDNNMLNLQSHILDFSKRYLNEKGWFHSLDGSPKDQNGPLPWYTYPSISFLTPLVKKDWRIFEYGCGNSTLWWTKLGGEVFSVEHDEEWFNKINPTLPNNSTLTLSKINAPVDVNKQGVFKEFSNHSFVLPVSPNTDCNVRNGLLNEEFQAYALEITKHEESSFDVVVVDGMARAFCAFLASRYVKQGGLIVFDNSDRWQYNAIYKYLDSVGFRNINFYGPGPVLKSEWCTSVFIKDLNILKGHAEVPEGSGNINW